MLLSPFVREEPVPNAAAWDFLADTVPIKPDKGFVTNLENPLMAWLYQKIQVELDRITTLTDIRIMLDEAPYIYGVCDKFINVVKGGKPRFAFAGGNTVRAERIVNNLIERIGYLNNRGDYLYNGIYLEAFFKKQISLTAGVADSISMDPVGVMKEFNSGMSLGQIDSLLGPLPAETCFRNSNHQDTFTDPSKAFYQVPEPYNNPYLTTYYGQTTTPMMNTAYQEWFHNMLILHPRWGNKRQKSHRYSRPSLKSMRKAYNRTELSSNDAVIQRHLAANRLIAIYLKRHVGQGQDIGATETEVKDFIDNFIRQYPTGFNKPGAVWMGSGEHEIKQESSMDISLSKPADIFMHFEFLSIAMPMSPLLAGFMGGEGGRVTGPLLEQLKSNLVNDIADVNTWEDQNILLPLCYFELFLNGIFDTQILVTHDKAQILLDIERKVAMSEVAANVMPREDYHKLFIEEKTGRAWAEARPLIVSELKDLGPAQVKEQINVDTGNSGSNKDSSQAPIKGGK